MILSLVEEAQRAGARLSRICEVLGLSVRTVERWRLQGDECEDRRQGPRSKPANKLSEEERAQMIAVATSAEFRELSPRQIVPRLVDQGVYLASEASFYRFLREEDLQHHRESSRPAAKLARPRALKADGPGKVWSWDITYLKTLIRGLYYYLYMVVDIYSRKIVGFAVHEEESAELGAELVRECTEREGVDPQRLVLHSDNGGPMKGSTMLATLQQLGIVPSFSRPGVSDDNPYSEALFRTLKYRPSYPGRPFKSFEEARGWVSDFVLWYNEVHLHSALRFITPSQRHSGQEEEILGRRQEVYEEARRRRPERWSRGCRNWEPVGAVELNPDKAQK